MKKVFKTAHNTILIVNVVYNRGYVSVTADEIAPLSLGREDDFIDNSLYPDEVDIDGETYIFDSLSCGCLHDDIKAVSSEFNTLIKLHLSTIPKEEFKILTKLIKFHSEEEINSQVLRFAKEIITEQ